ncbi:MAG: PsiF family protein [Pararobbsia sp.]
MRNAIAAIAATLAVSFALPCLASSQTDKMTACNKQAAGKKGDERKAFMSACLSSAPAKPMTQQERMTDCNKQATGKKGDERKTFMSSCLSNKS